MFYFIQMFADEATVPAASGVSAPEGSAAPTAEVQEAPAAEQKKSLRELIDGDEDYKNEYKTMQSDAIRRRVKDADVLREKVRLYDEMSPTLAQYYGIDPSDLAGIVNAVKGDNGFFKKTAVEKNTSPEAERLHFNVSEENRRMKKQLEAIKADKEKQETTGRWAKESEAMKEIYPTFDFEKEFQNKDFARLVMNGVPVQIAYESIHREEHNAAMIQYARRLAAEQIAQGVAANQTRPVEGGLSTNASPKPEVNPRNMSKDEREKIRQRVRRGEKVTF